MNKVRKGDIVQYTGYYHRYLIYGCFYEIDQVCRNPLFVKIATPSGEGFNPVRLRHFTTDYFQSFLVGQLVTVEEGPVRTVQSVIDATTIKLDGKFTSAFRARPVLPSKAGQLVVLKKKMALSGIDRGESNGSTYRVKGMANAHLVRVDGLGHAYPKDWFAVLDENMVNDKGEIMSKESKRATSNKSDNRSYTFNVSNVDKVDFNLIKEDLTAENPVALVVMTTKKSGVKYAAIIHDSIAQKMSEHWSDAAKDMKHIKRFVCPWRYLKGLQEFSAIVKEVKAVKRLPWTNKCDVKVSIPKV